MATSVYLGHANQSNYNEYAQLEPSLNHFLMKWSHKVCEHYFHEFLKIFYSQFTARCNQIVMVDDLVDYNGMIQNIVWSKRWIDIESRQEILNNSDILRNKETVLDIYLIG